MGGFKDRIYRYSPLFLKQLLLNIVAKRNNNKRYTHSYSEYLEKYLSIWKMEKSVVNDYQSKMLTRLLKECHAYVLFYQEDFKRKKISEREIEKNPYIVLSK